MRDGYEYYAKRVFSKIENGQLKTLLNSYFEGLYTTLEEWTFNRIFNEMINSFENVKITDLTWDLMCNQIRNMKSGYKYLIRFYSFAQKSGACLGCHDEYLKRNSWILFDNKDIHVNESNISKFYFSGGSPENFFIISNGKFPPCYIYIDTANSKLNKIFNLFIEFREGLLTNEVMLADFLRNFELSLGQYSSLINDMRDFNYETFDTQFKYFSTNDKKRQIRILYLKSFYVFLIRFFEDIREKHDVLNIEHGIDKAFLCKPNFSTLYEEGYKVVYLNKFDSVPVFDKWYVAQNRRNHSTVYKSDDYVPFDFTRVKDHTMRKELKEWIFLSDKSLKSLKNMVNCVFLFFEFVEGDEIKKFRSNIVSISDYINEKNNFIINESNVMVFRQFGKQSFDSEETLNSYISSIRTFVKYIDSKHIYPISSGIYDFLTVKTSKGLSGKKIEDEDLRKMVLAFKDNMLKGNYIDKLFWIFMHLMLTTNFRPNDICSLKINCIADAMKTGDKVLRSKDKSIKMKTKTSRGKEIDVNPSEYTIRAINEAILVTDFIRKSGKKNQLGDYIFIQRDPHGNTAGINYDLFYRKFKQITGGLELKGGPYTVNNCRHTYMTKLFEEAVKNGNVYKSIIATGHRDYATTIKHYIKPEIRDYLEAFYGVTLGNITLKGEIVANLEDSMENLPKDIREITVKSGCGFCKSNITIRCIDCLLCSNFIVTIDRIPYFENSIEEINLKIKNQSILHEKEHLLSIKKLYVSYLAELVTLKENEEAEI